MLGFNPGWIWKICWYFLTPASMTVIVIYTFVFFELPKDGSYSFSTAAHIAGWCLSSVALLQVPIFAVYEIYNKKGYSLWEVSHETKELESSENYHVFLLRKLRTLSNRRHIGDPKTVNYFKSIKSR